MTTLVRGLGEHTNRTYKNELKEEGNEKCPKAGGCTNIVNAISKKFSDVYFTSGVPLNSTIIDVIITQPFSSMPKQSAC